MTGTRTNRNRITTLLIVVVATLPATLARRAAAADPPAPVVVIDDAATSTLANGVVSLTVNKANANLLSLRFRGTELMSRGGGYWNIYGKTPGQPNTQQKGTPSVFRVTQDPARNGGALGRDLAPVPLHRARPRRCRWTSRSATRCTAATRASTAGRSPTTPRSTRRSTSRSAPSA